MLEHEFLIGFEQKINERSTRFPLLDLFPREMYPGKRITFRGRVVELEAGRWTGLNGPAHQVKYGELDDLTVMPVAHRPYDEWDSDELVLFAEWWDIKVKGGTPPQSMDADVASKVAQKVQDITWNGQEAAHDLLVGALLGQLEFEFDDETKVISLGHPTVDSPATSWDDPDAPIISDLALMADQFIDQNHGVEPDTIVMNRKLYSQAFVGNTDMRPFIQGNPNASLQFGVGGTPNAMAENKAGDVVPGFQGYTWITVDGPHIKGGSTEERWPVNTISFCSLNQGVESVLEWAMTRNEYNSTPGPKWETWMEKEPKKTKTRRSDNCAPVVKRHGAVQPCQVLFT
jgi:hypothetical protein